MIFIILISSTFASLGENNSKNNIEKSINFDNSWIEQIDEIQIVHLNGSFYQMGYQQGFHLKEEILQNLRGLKQYIIDKEMNFSDFFEIWEVQKNYVSNEPIEFLQGISDAIGVPFEEIAFMWGWEHLIISRCTNFVCWGNATENSEIIHVRSLDWPDYFIDPVSGRYVEENFVLIVAKPDNGFAFMYPAFAGFGVDDGFNENGISVSALWSDNNDSTLYGSPLNMRLFESLLRSETASDAINIIKSNRTIGYNFIVTGIENPIGYILEITANNTYIGNWDSDSEDIYPFWQIKDVVRRVNMFIDPKLASTQREIYNPRDFRYILGLKYDFSYYANWLRYKAMSNGIETNWGKINLNNSIDIIRNLYSGEFDFFWKLFVNIRNDLPSRWQFSINPQTGDILISVADRNNRAHMTDVHYFNFYDLLSSEPP